MGIIAGAVSGVVAFTLGGGVFVAVVVTVLVGGFADAGIALRNRLRKNR